MSDPSKAPGYRISTFRFLKLLCELSPNLPPHKEMDNVTAKFDYTDNYKITDQLVIVEQVGVVTITDEKDTERTLLRIEAVLEGVFAYSGEQNINPEIFATKYAPAILFPYLREAFTRLTSNSAPFTPIVMPPMNVQLIKAEADNEKAGDQKP